MSTHFWSNSQFGGGGFEAGTQQIYFGVPDPTGSGEGGGGGGNNLAMASNNDMVERANLPLACPMYKFNKHQHRDCREKQIRHIADLRHHLQRSHGEAPVFCPTCKRVFNGNNNRHNKRDEHIRQASCHPSNQPDPIWINPQSLSRLQGTSEYGTTPEERRWYYIWEEIFGRNTRYPDSCYHLTSAATEMVNDAAEEFIAQNLNRVVARLQHDIYATYGPQSLGVSGPMLAMVARRALSEFKDFFARNEDIIGMSG
ncbi:hypothetical protein QBC44DRAFT_327280 [Cladorrhinum sp. PSN332]|nr:hypothetical protein QBC44DRAFT_327280 [Cladorrhinum sp. PSN332]